MLFSRFTQKQITQKQNKNYFRNAFFAFALGAQFLSFNAYAQEDGNATESAVPDIAGQARLIATPNQGHKPFIDVINAAQESIRMTMYHLTDTTVADALIAAQARGVDVKVILDGRSLKDKGRAGVFQKLQAGDVQVKPSSPAFSITHAKSMIADNHYVMITAINLTLNASDTRDFGVILTDPSVVTQMNSLFESDWANAENNTGITPAITQPNLVVSPTNSESKLLALINSAQKSIVLTVENLGSQSILQALQAAAGRRVTVQVMVPMCDKNPNPLYNYPLLKALAESGVHTKVMPNPSTTAQPYMHSKMIVADGLRAYVGSENFSMNSLKKAREIGLLFSRKELITQMLAITAKDWQVAVEVPEELPTNCPKF